MLGKTIAEQRRIAVISQKGGCGKSTFAHNLMVLLNLLNFKVCGVDLDSGAPCGFSYLGFNPEAPGLFELLTKQATDISQIIISPAAYPNLSYIPGIKNSSWNTGMQRSFDADDLELLRNIVESETKVRGYDFVVMDTSPAIDKRLIEQSQIIFVMVDNAPGSEYNNKEMIVNLCQSQENPAYLKKIYVIANKDSSGALNDLRKSLSRSVFDQLRLNVSQDHALAENIKPLKDNLFFDVLPYDPFIQNNPIFVTRKSHATDRFKHIVTSAIDVAALKSGSRGR